MDEEKTRDQSKFMVRMPDGMRERIAEQATANNRSMNAEVVARLQASLDGLEQGLELNAFERFAADHAKATALEALEAFMATLPKSPAANPAAYQAGAEAYDAFGAAGRSRNPYPPKTKDFASWEAGFTYEAAINLERAVDTLERVADRAD